MSVYREAFYTARFFDPDRALPQLRRDQKASA